MNDKIKLNEKLLEVFRFHSAKYILGTENADDIKLLIDFLMNEGVYIDEFIGILDSPSNLADISPFFEKVLARFEFNIS